MPTSPTRHAANQIPAAALALLGPAHRRAIQAAAIGPTDEDKTQYCEFCRRLTGASPLCDRCTMEGLLLGIAHLGDLVTREVGEQAAALADIIEAPLAEEIARVTHEVNRAHCESIGDFSQVPWDEAPQWQRDSAIAGVQAVIDGSATTPEEQHENWSRHKLADGWTYGPVKDPIAKTHPCLVPYDQLPPEQQEKDRLFRAVVTAMLAISGEHEVPADAEEGAASFEEAPAQS